MRCQWGFFFIFGVTWGWVFWVGVELFLLLFLIFLDITSSWKSVYHTLQCVQFAAACSLTHLYFPAKTDRVPW